MDRPTRSCGSPTSGPGGGASPIVNPVGQLVPAPVLMVPPPMLVPAGPALLLLSQIPAPTCALDTTFSRCADPAGPVLVAWTPPPPINTAQSPATPVLRPGHVTAATAPAAWAPPFTSDAAPLFSAASAATAT